MTSTEPLEENKWWETLPQQLKYLREQEGLSQTELGKRLGIDRGIISHIESGRRNVSVNILVRLSQYFKLPINDLLGVDLDD